MTTDVHTTLANLMPTERLAVMDLLEQAGIDVSGWLVTAAGKPVKTPRANPHYCYNWAFGSETKGFLVCVWHASLNVIELPIGPAIAYQENIRDLALSLDRIAIDRTQPAADRNRARDQAKRARAFDQALQLSFRTGAAVKMIVNEGDQRTNDELGARASTVKLRHLDSENWFVHHYDNDTGDTTLVRGVPLAVVMAPATVPPSFVDQFSEPTAAALRETSVWVRDRSAAVREAVLRRAQGVCELCGEPGFVTTSGSVYLETHHVVALAADGPDHPSNVVAVCPQDHRRAHFSAERDEITVRLKEIATARAG